MRAKLSGIVWCVSVLWILAPRAAAQGRKLNAPLPGGGSGDIGGHLLSPDGERVVYHADQDVDGVFELYSVPVDGSAPAVKLSGPLVAGGGVEFDAYRISLDGTRVVYAADQDTLDVVELYSVPMLGGIEPVKLNAPLPSGGDVATLRAPYQFTPDGSQVLYLAEQRFDGVVELYLAPADGSAPPVRLSGTVNTTGVLSFRLSPDGQRVVYFANHGASLRDLFVVPLDGSAAPLQLSMSTLHNVQFPSYRISADSVRLVYVSDEDPLTEMELYSAPLDGSASRVKLNPPSLENVHAFQLTPDGASVVFSGDSVPDLGQTQELFRVPIAGGSAVRLSDPTAGSGVFFSQNFDAFQLSPDGTRVVYAFRDTVAYELFSAPVDGSSTPTRLSAPFPPGGTIEMVAGPAFAISPDGAAVVYQADQVTDGVLELFVAPTDGSAAAQRLSGPMVQGGGLASSSFPDPNAFRISLDGLSVVYIAEQDTQDVPELYGVSIAGGTPVKLHGSLPLGRFVTLLLQTPGPRAVFVASLNAPAQIELFSAPLDGSAPALRLNPPLVPGVVLGDVTRHEATRDARRVVYLADQDQDEVFELYSVSTDHPGAPVRLNRELLGDVEDFVLSPDSQAVVYSAGQDLPQARELYRVPTDGSTDPVQLSQDLPAGRFVQSDFQFSPDGAWVLYRADAEAFGVQELYRVPSDGSAAPTRISLPLSHPADVFDFAVSPDSQRVLYRANSANTFQIDLFSVALGGTSTPTRVNGTLVVNRAVTDFVFTSDGQRVAYRADERIDGVPELFVAPSDASAPAMPLHPPLVVLEQIESDFRLSEPDRVVYRLSKPQGFGRIAELYSAPLDASVAPQRLNQELVTGGNVDRDFVLSPDSTRVLFRADAILDEAFDLYSVPVDGSAPAVLLSVHGFNIDVEPGQFQASLDSTRAVYIADQNAGDNFKLYSAPIDGSAPAVELSAPLVANGDVRAFQLHSTGGWVVYRADQRVDGREELFAVPFLGGTPRVLNGRLIAGGSVQSDVTLTQRGFVFYRADQDVDEALELYFSFLGEAAQRRAATPGRTVVR